MNRGPFGIDYGWAMHPKSKLKIHHLFPVEAVEEETIGVPRIMSTFDAYPGIESEDEFDEVIEIPRVRETVCAVVLSACHLVAFPGIPTEFVDDDLAYRSMIKSCEKCKMWFQYWGFAPDRKPLPFNVDQWQPLKSFDLVGMATIGEDLIVKFKDRNADDEESQYWNGPIYRYFGGAHFFDEMVKVVKVMEFFRGHVRPLSYQKFDGMGWQDKKLPSQQELLAKARQTKEDRRKAGLPPRNREIDPVRRELKKKSWSHRDEATIKVKR